MAPVGMRVVGWAAATSLSPELILASLLVLIALVKFLSICTQCQRRGFEVDENSQAKRTSSNLIRVVKMEEAAMPRENPSFDYMAGEQVPSPENGSIHMTAKSGEVWFTPWRTHTLTYGHKDDSMADHEVNPAASIAEFPANTFHRIPYPSVVIPEQDDVHGVLPSHPPYIPTKHNRPLEQSETQKDSSGLPESYSGSQPQPWLRAPRAYESLEDMRAVISEGTESSGYQTVAELNTPTPPPFEHMPEAGSDLPIPPAPYGEPEERMMGMELNAMYAQVSKKYKSPTQLSQTLSEWDEPLPPPQIQLEEEEDPAPPIPDRNFAI
ncbi:hypothetical protein GJAV_G00014860 [Gymnothorax javanicus]|nr:hypothetical protein GJAV_G00014860 [Gymnothorax javanicus]